MLAKVPVPNWPGRGGELVSNPGRSRKNQTASGPPKRQKALPLMEGRPARVERKKLKGKKKKRPASLGLGAQGNKKSPL